MRARTFAGKFLVFLVVIFSMLGIGICADEPTYLMSYVEEAELAAVGTDDAASDIFLIDPAFSGNWSFSGDILRESKQTIDDASVVQINLKESSAMDHVLMQYNGVCDLSGYNTMTFLLNISTEEEASGCYRVTVEMTRRNQTMYSIAYAEVNRWQNIVVDVSDCDWVDSVSIEVTYESDEMPKRIRLASPYMGYGDRFGHIDRYMTPAYEVSNGRLINTGETVTLHPSGGATNLVGRFALDFVPEDNVQAFMLVTLSGEISGGTLTASLLDASAENGVYTDTAPLQLQNGRNIYSFPFTASDDLISYRLSFRNAVCEMGGIKIESVSVVWTDYTAPQSTGLGYVSGVALNRESGELVVSGSVAQSALAEHIKDELVLYAVPYTEEIRPGEVDSSLWAGVELLRSKISMSFELTLDAETTSRYIGTHMFYVVLEKVDGEESEKSLLSQPKGVDGMVNDTGEMSSVGIDGASAVGVFESNASHVIVDVPFDRLLRMVESAGNAETESENMEENESETAVGTANGVKYSMPDGTGIYFNEDFLDSLQAEISFYNSARIEVYLRVTGNTLSFTDSIASLDERDLAVYSAIMTYLFSSGKCAVSGVLIGDAIAYTEQMFDVIPAYDYTRKLAELMRVTYSTAYPYLDTEKLCVIIPYEDGGVFNGVINQMLSIHVEQEGDMPWCAMYCFDSDIREEETGFGGVVSRAHALVETAQAFSVRGASTVMFCYEPDGDFSADVLAQNYDALCTEAEKYNPRAVFVSVDRLDDSLKEQFYRVMKHVRQEDKNSQIEDFTAEYITDTAEDSRKHLGKYTIWDFSDVYYSNGWIAGGAVSSCSTGWSSIFSDYNGIYSRALQTPVYPDYENGMASGIVLRNFSRVVNLRYVDDMRFVFAIDGTEEASTVIFTIGNEVSRAEYYLNDVEPGTVHTVVCSLAGYSGIDSVSYIGVMVYSSDSAALEIETVEFESDTLTSPEIKALFAPASVPEPDRGYIVYYIGGVMGVLSVFIMALMVRRDREEAELRETPVHPTRRRKRYNKIEKNGQ